MSKHSFGLVQHQGLSTPAEALDASINGIHDAVAQGAELVLLQELHTGPYFCQQENAENFTLAETIPGPTTDALAKIARDKNIVIVASIFEKRAAGLYHNTAVVIERDGSIVGRYRKMHIPDDPGYYEKYYFTPGDGDSAHGFRPIQTSVGKLGILVCWDQWYPEAARLMALAGADVLLYPTAIGWEPQDDQAEKDRQLDAWITVQRAHAIANGIPVLSCNRVGFEADPHATVGDSNAGVEFWGNSFIAGPQGELLVRAPHDQASVLVTEFDFAHNEKVRQAWPFLRDRRIDAYGDLLKRYRDL